MRVQLSEHRDDSTVPQFFRKKSQIDELTDFFIINTKPRI